MNKYIKGVLLSLALLATVAYYASVANAWGTGTLVTNNGIILTNAHVVTGRDELTPRQYFLIYIGNETYHAHLLYMSHVTDLAIIQLDEHVRTNCLRIVQEQQNKGDELRAVLYNVSYGDIPSTSVSSIYYVETFIDSFERISSWGVSGSHLDIIRDSIDLRPTYSMPGNSGSPLIDNYGNLVSVNWGARPNDESWALTNNALIAFVHEANLPQCSNPTNNPKTALVLVI